MTLMLVKLSELIASDAINARPPTKEGLEELAASIRAKGLIQPLVVRPADAGGKYEIVDGRRRFAAMMINAKNKHMKKSDLVPVSVRNETDAEALESSLAANVMRLGMHPVEEFEAIARLAGAGRSDEEIAATFAIDVRRVRQRKALGNLAPVIREAYRKGKLDEKQVQAFTVHPDHGVQEAAFEKLRRGGPFSLQPFAIRQELMPGRVSTIQCEALQLVGEETYLAAGGTLTEPDFFDQVRYVDDVPLAKKLARDFLRGQCGKLQAEGWAWALPALDDDDPDVDDFMHVRGVDDEAHDYTAEEKARGGCLVDGRDGALHIYRGLLRASDLIAEEAGDDAPGLGAEIESDELPATDPHHGGKVWPTPADDPFAISGALRESITEAQSHAIAQLVRDDRSIIAALPAAKYLSRVREAFDVRDYFKRAEKETALAAIEEIVEAGGGVGLAPIDVLAGMKKGELAAAAAGVAKACGWLPPQLRHPAYALEISAQSEAAE